jgi:hypothetical protein
MPCVSWHCSVAFSQWFYRFTNVVELGRWPSSHYHNHHSTCRRSGYPRVGHPWRSATYRTHWVGSSCLPIIWWKLSSGQSNVHGIRLFIATCVLFTHDPRGSSVDHHQYQQWAFRYMHECIWCQCPGWCHIANAFIAIHSACRSH